MSDRSRRGTLAMRPWDWAFPSRPVTHREVVSALPSSDEGRPPRAFRELFRQLRELENE